MYRCASAPQIIAVKTYDTTLANVDWLHASAESLLTLTNLINVFGLKQTLDGYLKSSGRESSEPSTPPPTTRLNSAALAGVGALFLASSAHFGLGVHDPFLGGIGDLGTAWSFGFREPANALSLPTWVIHVSSLLEWLVAMGLIWRIGLASGNERWKGLTWAMIPSHSSGICACVYHLFYNAETLGFVVLAQAALTLIGNTTLAFAAWRLAVSNGWQVPFSASGDVEGRQVRAQPVEVNVEVNDQAGSALGIAQICLLSVLGSYLIKYGETLCPFVLDADALAAAALIAIPTAFNMWKWSERSKSKGDFEGYI